MFCSACSTEQICSTKHQPILPLIQMFTILFNTSLVRPKHLFDNIKVKRKTLSFIYLWLFSFCSFARPDLSTVPYNITTRQKSTFLDKGPELAIDGDNETYSLTGIHEGSWWRMDLQAEYNITGVRIRGKK